MSGNDNNHVPGDEDEIAAIAAAAYVVNNLDELNHRAMSTQVDGSLAKARSKGESIAQQEPYDSSKQFSGQTELSSSRGTQDSSNEPKLEPKNTNNGPAKTVQKRPTFAEKPLLDQTGGHKPKLEEAQEEEDFPVPVPRPTKRTATSSLSSPSTSSLPPKFPATKPGNPPLFEIQSQTTAEASAPKIPATELENPRTKEPNGTGDAAYAWERDEMTRIRVKYENISQTIGLWENEKAAAAKHKQDETERELERRREKALREFRTEMERIGQIAGGARAQAEERRRNEEAKTREKANKIRRSGKAPGNTTTICFCF